MKHSQIDRQYIAAFKVAPPETKRAILRFMKKPEAYRDRKPLLYFILGSGTPNYKMSKEASAYTDESPLPDTQTCDNCIFAFQNVKTKKFICSQIRGNIKPKGWCDLWKA